MSQPPDKEPGTDYAVGYGKPPKDKQFKKGRSGNPAGRPKKPPPVTFRNPWDDLLVLQTSRVKLNGKWVVMSQKEIFYRRQANDAARGDAKAAKLLLDDWLDAYEAYIKYERANAPGKAPQQKRILMVPVADSEEAWSRHAVLNQARLVASHEEKPDER